MDTVKKPRDKETTGEIVKHGECVAILAIDAEDMVLLIRQLHHAVGKENSEDPIREY